MRQNLYKEILNILKQRWVSKTYFFIIINQSVSHWIKSERVSVSVSQSIRQSVTQWPQTSESVCQLVNQIVSHPMNSDSKLHCMKSVSCKIPVCCRSYFHAWKQHFCCVVRAQWRFSKQPRSVVGALMLEVKLMPVV